MRYSAISHVGLVRAKNDDSAYVGRHLAVVADGMGGHAGGNVASASTVLDLIHLDHDEYQGGAGTVLADEIQTANSLLSELVHVDPRLAGMGTTVTALLLADGKLEYAHIGDSRAYRLREGKYEQVSVDHTFVQRLIDEGRLRPEEAETHPHKNVLMRVLGDVDASPELDLATIEVRAGERWLLCSDGLNYVSGDVVERVVRNTPDLQECAEKLIDLTLAVGSPDNVTVVVLEIVEAGPDDVTTSRVDVVPPATLTPLPAAPSEPVATGSTFGGGRTDSDESKTGEPGLDFANDRTVTQHSTEAEPHTDPNLGAHLVAEVLRMELATRPHELVGAAATAAETGSMPTVVGRSAARRAATILTHKSAPTLSQTDSSHDEGLETVTVSRDRKWLSLVVAASLAILVAAGLWLGYAWTQTRYYVGEFQGNVAIYNGVSQQLGPIQLSRVHEVTEVKMSRLPEFSQQRVRQTVPAQDLTDAEEIVDNLKPENPAPCVTPKPTASPSATPGKSSSSKPTGTPTSTAKSASPTSSPSATASPTGSTPSAASASPTAGASSSASPGSAPTTCGGAQ
ncbi:PP2C family protein-serine/threonine phosphatase [Pseudarthrobacter sp. J1738]|uniref:PP2C family protein-serine/threonine phosphatase n=1 Tax=Pseudarthrobacter sp. J1738 TaxID=3420446 RepID=UPI003D2CAC37